MNKLALRILHLASQIDSGKVSPSEATAEIQEVMASLRGAKAAKNLGGKLTGKYVARRLQNGVESLQGVRQEMRFLTDVLEQVRDIRPEDQECQGAIDALLNLQHQMGVLHDLARLAVKYRAMGERLLAPRVDVDSE